MLTLAICLVICLVIEDKVEVDPELSLKILNTDVLYDGGQVVKGSGGSREVPGPGAVQCPESHLVDLLDLGLPREDVK